MEQQAGRQSSFLFVMTWALEGSSGPVFLWPLPSSIQIAKCLGTTVLCLLVMETMNLSFHSSGDTRSIAH